MRARVILVHDEPGFVCQLTTALESVGHRVTTFPDPLVAWDIVNTGQRFEALITRIQFQAGKSNGVALARMARSRQPGIRVLFTALPEYAAHADGLGTFLAMPVSIQEVTETLRKMLEDC
jgi:DNA-binding NtrC family response regulator